MPTPNPIAADSALLASVLAGDAAAVNRLLADAEALARAHIRRTVPRSAHDDLVNTYLAHLWDGNWRRLRAWRAEAPLAHYLARIFTRCQIDYLRALSTERQVTESLAQEPTVIEPDLPAESDPERAIGVVQLRECLDKGINRVTPNQRELIRLRHDESLKHREIAEQLGRALGTIASNLAEAEQALLRRMLHECAELLDDMVGVDRRGRH